MSEIYKNGKTLDEYWEPKFLLPALELLDRYSTGRWQYWLEALKINKATYAPIPKINWTENAFNNEIHKVLIDCTYGHYDCNFYDFLDFILYGLGYEDCTDWKTNVHYSTINRWEKNLQEILPEMVAKPYPYFTRFIEEEMGRGQKKGTGFFATPMHVSVMMAEMELHNLKDVTASMIDPSCGTGNMLLAASNYTVNQYGVDINPTVLKGAKIHAWLYMPWMIAPMPALAMQPPFICGDALTLGLKKQIDPFAPDPIPLPVKPVAKKSRSKRAS